MQPERQRGSINIGSPGITAFLEGEVIRKLISRSSAKVEEVSLSCEVVVGHNDL